MFHSSLRFVNHSDSEHQCYFNSSFVAVTCSLLKGPLWRGWVPYQLLQRLTGNVITFCQHFDNEPLSFGHNYSSGPIIRNAGEWPAGISLSLSAFIAFHCLSNWLWGHFTWRHGSYLVVTQQSSILDVFFRCAVGEVRGRMFGFHASGFTRFHENQNSRENIFHSTNPELPLYCCVVNLTLNTVL